MIAGIDKGLCADPNRGGAIRHALRTGGPGPEREPFEEGGRLGAPDRADTDRGQDR